MNINLPFAEEFVPVMHIEPRLREYHGNYEDDLIFMEYVLPGQIYLDSWTGLLWFVRSNWFSKIFSGLTKDAVLYVLNAIQSDLEYLFRVDYSPINLLLQ